MKTGTQRTQTASTPAHVANAPAPTPDVDHDAAPDIEAQLGAAAQGHSFASVGITPAPPGAIQPKLTVGAADDTYEDEADRVAGQVMRMPESAVQRMTHEDDEDTIRSKPDVQRTAEGSFDAGSDVESRIAARRGGGSPLPDSTRAFMEPRFGADFSGVRVHADAEADAISQRLSARAFTTGSDIYFRQGAYSPGSSGGQELLAHELTHVVQQGVAQSTPAQQRNTVPASLTQLDRRVQRYLDLSQKYAGAVDGLTAEEKAAWLQRFTGVQQLLNNRATVERHLLALEQSMIAHRATLSEALAAGEQGTWSPQRPILTDFVPADMFEDLVRGGHLFEDLVGTSHGVQTHRMQWYIIKQELGGTRAFEIYQEAVHPRWKVLDKGALRNMWDFIVDSTGAQPYDFTQPDRLEDYMLELYNRWFSSWRSMGTLAAEVNRGHTSQRDDKDVMRRRYPPEDMFTPPLKEAVAAHKAIKARSKDLPYREKAAAEEEAKQVVQRVAYEQVKNTTTIDGRQATYIWTGWVPLTDSQAGGDRFAGAYLVPTVAYPAEP